MNSRVGQTLVTGLVPFFRAFDAASHACHLDGWRRVVRHARWKAKLASLGKGTVIHPSVIIHGAERVHVGARCSIAEFVHIWGRGGITIGDDVLVASHTAITSFTHDKHATRYRDSVAQMPVVIGDNVWIGAGTIVLPGVSIGRGAIVGAGTVVTRNVPEGVVVVGVPARAIDQSGYCIERS